jgi:hypothetical protein
VIGVHNRNTNQAFTEGQGMLPERDFGKKWSLNRKVLNMKDRERELEKKNLAYSKFKF